MKIIQETTKPHRLINTLILIMILSIPFYQIRIPLHTTSLSVLTIFLVISCIILLFHNKNTIFTHLRSHTLLWVFALLFVVSFIPPLFCTPTHHNYGVFVEWILLPTATSFLLSIHLSRYNIAKKYIFNSLFFIFFGVVVIALFFLFNNNMTYDGRLNAFFLSPNHLAMFLTPLFFITAYQLFLSQNILWRAFLSCAITCGVIVLFFTYSFSSFLALAITSFFVTLLFCKKRAIIFIVFCIISLTSLFFFYQKILHSDHVFERNSFSSRLMIWDTSVYYIQKSPLMGYALDEFQTLYLSAQPHFTPYLEWAVPTPHNTLLTLWVSGGFFSVYAFYLFCSYVLYRTLSSYAKNKNPANIFYCGALFSILLGGVLDTTYWKNDLAIIFWVIVALAVSTLTFSTKSKN